MLLAESLAVASKAVGLTYGIDLLGGNLIGFKTSLDEIPQEEEIAVVCVGGATSQYATQYLQQQGYDAKSMQGGMSG